MRTWRIVLLAAILLGILAAGATYQYVRNVTVTSSKAAMARTARVVVAKKQIPAYTAITQDMVYQKEVAESSVEPGAASLEEVIGSITKQEIVQGRQVVRSMLFDKREAAGLAFSIPAGKRAVTIRVNEVIGVGGFVKPGDRVDILGTFKSDVSSVDMTTTVLRNIEVLAVAQEMDEKDRNKARVAASVTLAVTPAEAEKLVLAEELGSLRLALCPLPEAASAGGYGQGPAGGQLSANAAPKPRRVTAAELIGGPARPEGASGFQAARSQTPQQSFSPVAGARGVPQQGPAGSHAAIAAAKLPAAPRTVEVIRGTERTYVTISGGGQK